MKAVSKKFDTAFLLIEDSQIEGYIKPAEVFLKASGEAFYSFVKKVDDVITEINTKRAFLLQSEISSESDITTRRIPCLGFFE